MSRTDTLLNLLPWAKTVATSKIDVDAGELSVLDDAVQEGILYVMERELDNEDSIKYNIVRGIDLFLRKHRERGYRRTMWQDSADAEFSQFIHGDNPDFEPDG